MPSPPGVRCDSGASRSSGAPTAVGSKGRAPYAKHPLLPALLAGGEQALGSFGLVAPAKTSASVLAKLEGDIDAILKMPDVQKRFDELGAEPGTVSGAAFGKFLADETAKWTKVIQENGLQSD